MVLLATTVVYGISLVVYRLFFSPLAKFPGPKLAAATAWYEVFFDLWTNNFPNKLEELHQAYGIITSIYNVSVI